MNTDKLRRIKETYYIFSTDIGRHRVSAFMEETISLLDEIIWTIDNHRISIHGPAAEDE